MKGYGFKCSIKNRDNTLVSSTSCNWGRILPGALIKLEGSVDYYEVECVDRLHIKDTFTVKNRNSIVINKNLKPYILNNDTIEMTHREYELSDSLVATAGQGYKVGDLLIAKLDNLNENATLEVTQTKDAGGIKAYRILNRGVYNELINRQVPFDTNGGGRDFELLFNCSQKSELSKLDRLCFNVTYEDKTTTLSFVHQLPSTIKSGEISLSKWKATLTRKFVDFRNLDFLNKSYQVYSDFTPYLNFQLMLPNQENIPEFMNNHFIKLDRIIGGLQAEIYELKTNQINNTSV